MDDIRSKETRDAEEYEEFQALLGKLSRKPQPAERKLVVVHGNGNDDGWPVGNDKEFEELLRRIKTQKK